MTTIAYVGCGSKKRDSQTMAKNIYTSNYFKEKWRVAEELSDYQWILSAKHGHLPPNMRIRPYDIKMSDYPLPESMDVPYHTVDEWADGVVESMVAMWEYFEGHDVHDPVEEVVVLAGKNYRVPILDRMRKFGAGFSPSISVVDFFADTSGIGYQRQKMSAARSQETVRPEWSES